MTFPTQIDDVTRRFIEPLNDETRKLLKPIRLPATDRMKVSLDDEGKRFKVHVYTEGYDGKHWQPSWHARKLLSRIPERKQLNPHSATDWMLAGTDFTAIVLNATWPRDKIEFDDDARVLFEFLLTRFVKQTECAKVYADYKMNHVIPDMPENFLDHPDYPLMEFQKVAFATQVDSEGANLWMEQGTGKTPIVIARINHEARRVRERENRMFRALVVVPKNVRTGWRNKLIQFAVRPGKITVLRGGQIERVKLMCEAFKNDDECEYTVVICSYETIIRSWSAISMVPWDLCCLDESHMIKGHYTKRWSQMKKLRTLCEERTGLTGTPYANTLFDVWTQLEWLGEGMSGFTSIRAFKKYYGKFLPRDHNRQFDKLVGYKNLPILQERITRLCFMITRAEALPYLPKKTYDVLEVTMTPKQREFYVQLQQRLMIEIENDLRESEETGKNKQLTANHILTKLLRLSQITAGYLKWDAQYDDEGNLLNENELFEAIIPNPKIDATIDFIKTTGEKEKVVVWSNWVPAIKMLEKRFEEENIRVVTYYGATKDVDRDEAERSYNQDPLVKVFLGNPAAGGVGLDLWGYWPQWANTDRDHGCNTRYVIYFSQNWSMIHRSQSEDRVMRRGTRAPVEIIDLTVPYSIDGEIAARVLGKQLQAMQLQDVRDVMKRILSNVPSTGDEDE